MQRLHLRPTPATLAQTEALLQLAGAQAIVLTDAGDQPLLEPPPDSAPLWDEISLHAFFANDIDLAALAPTLPGVIGWESLEPQDWVTSTQPTTPLRFGRLSIGSTPKDGPAHLLLPPGVGFGTGHHPTTALCLEWLSTSSKLSNGLVLDYGCGSGILALAALRLGAASAVGVDHDPQAVAAAERNAQANGLQDRCQFLPPEHLRLPRTADVLCANIVFNTLAERASDFARWTTPGGALVLSGILEDQVEPLRGALAGTFTGFEVRKSQGWCLLAATRC